MAHDLFVHHFGSRTFVGNGIDAAQLLGENARRFAAKWGLKKTNGKAVARKPWLGEGMGETGSSDDRPPARAREPEATTMTRVKETRSSARPSRSRTAASMAVLLKRASRLNPSPDFLVPSTVPACVSERRFTTDDPDITDQKMQNNNRRSLRSSAGASTCSQRTVAYRAFKCTAFLSGLIRVSVESVVKCAFELSRKRGSTST